MLQSRKNERTNQSGTTVERKSERELIVTRTFNGPPRILFEAWTNPELLKRWWAPRSLGVSLFDCDSDLRVGGSYRYAFGRDPTNPEVFSGRYVEVKAPTRLVLTQLYERMREAGEAIITITFEDTDGGTRITLHQLFPSKEALDGAVASGMEHGMRETFDQLDALVAEIDTGPHDIPASRPVELDSFDALIGTWELEASFKEGYFGPRSPAIVSRSARTTFEWLEGRFFLVQRFVSDHPAAPSGIAIVGPGSAPGTFEQHYYDSRGVSRIYRTNLDGRTWRVWRDEPGFYQRYTGTISEDGREVVGAWEGSSDGREWKRDFGLNYVRIADR